MIFKLIKFAQSILITDIHNLCSKNILFYRTRCNDYVNPLEIDVW